jgi:endonuclease/exonuclease/phosphatase family metal-dependent hydrolase
MRCLPAVLLAVLVLGACSDDITGPSDGELTVLDGSAPAAGPGSVQLTVMTRNMYVGTDVDRVIETSDPNQVPFVVGQLWELLLANDYGERARAMAREIATTRPHVVGLQEVSLFRTQSPADFQLNATDVAIDFMPTLLTELAALGEFYELVVQVQDTDVELPRLNSDFTLTDVRLTDYDAILVRSDVRVTDVSGDNYEAFVPGPGGLQILRGWTSVDVELGGESFRILNTHLEPVETAGGIIQAQQADELVALLADDPRPTILLGDLNTESATGSTYQQLVGEGFLDAWDLREGPPATGFTCCHAEDLSSDAESLHKRIDHVLLRNFDSLWPPSGPIPVRAEIVGDEPSDKTTSGLWPSDHAGMVVRTVLPNPGN